MNRFVLYIAMMLVVLFAAQARAEVVNVGLNRAELVGLKSPMAEVVVANPEIADIVVHGDDKISVIGKEIGSTNMRFFDAKNQLIRELDIIVGYDIPAIRRALKKFFPEDNISVDTINNSIAVSGVVPDAQAASRAMQIVYEFVKQSRKDAAADEDLSEKDNRFPGIVNLLTVNSGQQVMLKVRIGEVKRTALKQLGISLLNNKSGDFVFGSNRGAAGIFDDITTDAVEAGTYKIPETFFNAIIGHGQGSAMIEALERDGVFKVLAEPNLTTVSGETASFLAGGEFPIRSVSQDGAVDISFKQYGVSLAFTPYVLSQNRVRLLVAPELSEIDNSEDSPQVEGASALTTRKATTTVELAPGEAFMIAGLIRDTLNSSIDEVPGIAEVPILSALMRSTSYQRQETELVISVTPYLVDPVVANEIRLPIDEFREPSVMEMFFYGALGSMGNDADKVGQTPVLEGPVGYMVE